MVRDFQTRDRQRNARADAGDAKSVCPISSWPASAAARTPSACSIPSSTTPTWKSTASKRRARASTRQRHAATLTKGTPGVLHGARSYLLQDGDGQILEAHSISAGLDYPGVGPEHSWLKDQGRVKYFSATDKEALDAFMVLSRARRHHPGAGIGACPRPCHARRAADGEGQDHRRLACRAAATRTCSPPPQHLGEKL